MSEATPILEEEVRDWTIRETIALRTNRELFVHLSLTQSDFEAAMVKVGGSLGIERNEAERLLKENKFQVRFGNANPSFGDVAKKGDFLGRAIGNLSSALERPCGSVFRGADGEIQLTLDVQRTNEQLPGTLKEGSGIDYTSLPSEVQVRVYEDVLKQFVVHEMVHVFQEMTRTKDLNNLEAEALFTLKAKAIAELGVLVSGAGAFLKLAAKSGLDLRNLALIGLAVGVFELLRNRYNKKYEWVEQEANDVAGKIIQAGIRNPIKFSTEHYLG